MVVHHPDICIYYIAILLDIVANVCAKIFWLFKSDKR